MKLKRDPYFLFLAAFILAGVVLAFVDPSPPAVQPGKIPDLAANLSHAQPAGS
jgi:hypothetical protein